MPEPMRVLMVGAGGVGDAAARIAVERDFFEAWVVADYDVERAERTVEAARGQAHRHVEVVGARGERTGDHRHHLPRGRGGEDVGGQDLA